MPTTIFVLQKYRHGVLTNILAQEVCCGVAHQSRVSNFVARASYPSCLSLNPSTGPATWECGYGCL